MAVSEVDICNMALLKIGAKPRINSLTEDTENARLCNTFYPHVRDALLRGHPWNCAIERKQITALATAPIADYDNQYQLPTNPWCLRILEVGTRNQQPIRWTVEGRKLLADLGSPKIVYIKRITDTNEFDASLVDALVLKLAMKIAGSLTSSTKTAKDLLEEYELISLPDAKSTDGQEQSVQAMQVNTYIDSMF